MNCPKCGEEWSEVAVVRNARREAFALAREAVSGRLTNTAPSDLSEQDFAERDCMDWTRKAALAAIVALMEEPK